MSGPPTSRQSPADLAIDGATLVLPTGLERASLYVADGRIAGVGPADRPARGRVDGSGLMALPGFVDTHVHLMEPADASREDWAHGTAAAAAAGVTTIIEHTHAAPVRSAGELRDKVEWLGGRSRVDFGLAAHAWPDRIDELEGVWRAGVAFMKAFTCTTHGVPGLDEDHLTALLELAASLGMPVLVHAEDEALVADAEAELRATGRSDPGLLPEWRGRHAEDVAVERVVRLADTTGARAVIAHASRAGIVDAIAAAAAPGSRVVAESCPQYFTLFESEVDREAGLRKFTPPARARSTADLDDMWAALADGRIHHISSDHAPSTLAQKRSGDIWDVPFGLPGLDTTSRILVDASVEGRISFERLAEVYAAAPARLYGLAAKGRLAPGADADVVLIDPAASGTITDEAVRSKAGWTPFAGRSVRGAIVATYLRGRPIHGDGAEDPASGVFVRGPGGR